MLILFFLELYVSIFRIFCYNSNILVKGELSWQKLFILIKHQQRSVLMFKVKSLAIFCSLLVKYHCHQKQVKSLAKQFKNKQNKFLKMLGLFWQKLVQTLTTLSKQLAS